MHLTHATRSLALHPSDPRSHPSIRGSDREGEAGPPRGHFALPLSLNLQQPVPENPPFAPLSFLLSDSTRAASMDSLLYRLLLRPAVYRTTIHVKHTARQNLLQLLKSLRDVRDAYIPSSFHCRVRICCLFTNVHFISI